MNDVEVGEGAECNKSIVAENVKIGKNVFLGDGDEAPNETNPNIYNASLVTIGEKTVIPDNVRIGKNCVVMGNTLPEDYPDGIIKSGSTLIKAGEEA